MCALVTGVQTCALQIFEEPFIGSGSRVLALPPLSTSGGFVQLMEFITLGATTRFEAGFDADRALQFLQEERINVFQGVPLFFERVAACAGFEKADLSDLRFTSVGGAPVRSEEHTSELQSLMRISYAVFCLKKKKITPLVQ